MCIYDKSWSDSSVPSAQNNKQNVVHFRREWCYVSVQSEKDFIDKCNESTLWSSHDVNRNVVPCGPLYIHWRFGGPAAYIFRAEKYSALKIKILPKRR
jgi:hypothetical protein